MWAASAVAILLVVIISVAMIVLVRRRRARGRARHLAALKAEGRLPDDVEGALRRASRPTRR